MIDFITNNNNNNNNNNDNKLFGKGLTEQKR